jgi:predicted metal-binding protein
MEVDTYHVVAAVAELLAHELIHPLGGLVVAAAGLHSGDYERHGCVVDFWVVSWCRCLECSGKRSCESFMKFVSEEGQEATKVLPWIPATKTAGPMTSVLTTQKGLR